MGMNLFTDLQRNDHPVIKRAQNIEIANTDRQGN